MRVGEKLYVNLLLARPVSGTFPRGKLLAYEIRLRSSVDESVHDWASHASDALRTLAEADLAGRLVSAGCRRIPDRPMCQSEP